MSKASWYATVLATVGPVLGSLFSGGATSASAAELPPMPIPKRLMVLAPHPDDALLAAGLILRTLSEGGQARIVNLTAGDAKNKPAYDYLERKGFKHPDATIDGKFNVAVNYGYWRQLEDHQAAAVLGLSETAVKFMGFPDAGAFEIWKRGIGEGESGKTGEAFRSSSTGLDYVPYKTALTPGAPNTFEAMVADLASQMSEFQPDLVVMTHPNDNHKDHAATYWLGQAALERSGMKNAVAVYIPLDLYGTDLPLELHRDQVFVEPKGKLPSPTRWFELKHTPEEEELKIAMIRKYPSQMAWEHPKEKGDYQGDRTYMLGYVGVNELYGVVSEAKEDAAFRRGLNNRIMLKRGWGYLVNVVSDWF